MQICVRCRGAKKMYKVGSAYSMIDCGGEKVTCPLCSGTGQMKTFAERSAKDDKGDEKPKRSHKKKTA